MISDYVQREQNQWEERERILEHDESEGLREWLKLHAYLRSELNEKSIGSDFFLVEQTRITFGNALATMLTPARQHGSNVYAIDFARQRSQFQNPEKIKQWALRLGLTPEGGWGWRFRRRESDPDPTVTNEELGLEIVKELVKIARSQG